MNIRDNEIRVENKHDFQILNVRKRSFVELTN